ncbi:MAG: nucleotide exchange factor GrpE [Akkermansiaceae bacterium]|nr:nucleotide exchange factor GrpE [Akkermansiaceae bacterium]NNM29430.1 nucleotide exchange factor GrpE [Akkermansiaceae bacterium]
MQQEAGNETDAPGGDAVPEGAGETGNTAAQEGEVAVVDEQESTAEELLEAQVTEWKDLAMRATADLDNFRKRISREKSEALLYANRALLEELLPILDNFDMGLQAAQQEEGSMILQGMQMVKKQLDDFLANNGVTEIPAEGQAFDPNVHEAVSQEACADTEEGKVLRVMRRGYMLRDRLLRPAHVVVAKSPGGEA